MQKWKSLPIKLLVPITILFFLVTVPCKAQEKIKDNRQLLYQLKIGKTSEKKRKREYVFKKEKSFVRKYNPVNLVFGSLLYFYQNALSPQFSADCLYHPTCSDFSKQAIQHYGLAKGVFLSADRISRCNRIAATSINPLKINPNHHHADDNIALYQFRK